MCNWLDNTKKYHINVRPSFTHPKRTETPKISVKRPPHNHTSTHKLTYGDNEAQQTKSNVYEAYCPKASK